MRTKKIIYSFLLLLIALQAYSETNRKALIIGNGDYETGKLANPGNDALKMKETLEKAGFNVLLETDSTLEQMEQGLVEFKKNINPGDIALLFYAGHGIQADGINYLLPVDNGDIENNLQLKRRAMDSDDYLKAMADSGSSLNIVILDACRDNPLNSESRGGPRGLAIMQLPKNSETIIVYSTKEGQTASDGNGKNSVFTTALLNNITTIDIGILEMFNAVGVEVKTATNNVQIPTTYSEPLSKSFSFFSSSKIAEEALQASQSAQIELEEMDKEYQQLITEMNNANSEAEKDKIKILEQKQQSILNIKKMEAQTLRETAEKAAADAKASMLEQSEKLAAAQKALNRQDELSLLAEEKRLELKQLAKVSLSSDPDVLIDTIEELKKTLTDINEEYKKALTKTLEDIEDSYLPRIKKIEKYKPSKIESDSEFEIRKQNEKNELEDEKRLLIQQRTKDSNDSLANNTALINDKLEETLKTLNNQVWKVQSEDVKLKIGDYDRNKKNWSMSIESKSKDLPVWDIDFLLDFSTSSADQIRAMFDAVESDALIGNFEWSIKPLNDEYGIYINTAQIINLLDNSIVISSDIKTPKKVAIFNAGSRKWAKKVWAIYDITLDDSISEIIINGEKITSRNARVITNTENITVDKQAKFNSLWYEEDFKASIGKISKKKFQAPKNYKGIAIGEPLIGACLSGSALAKSLTDSNYNSSEDSWLELGLNFLFTTDDGSDKEKTSLRPEINLDYFFNDVSIFNIGGGLNLAFNESRWGTGLAYIMDLSLDAGVSISSQSNMDFQITAKALFTFFYSKAIYNSRTGMRYSFGCTLPFYSVFRFKDSSKTTFRK